MDKARTLPGPGSGTADGDGAALRGFMDAAAAAARSYAELSDRCGKDSAASLRALAEAERGHLRELQIEYFLLTGDSYVPRAAAREERGLLCALRRGCLAEAQRYEMYMTAAQGTASRALAAVYTAHAADEARHEQELRGLIARCFG